MPFDWLPARDVFGQQRHPHPESVQVSRHGTAGAPHGSTRARHSIAGVALAAALSQPDCGQATVSFGALGAIEAGSRQKTGLGSAYRPPQLGTRPARRYYCSRQPDCTRLSTARTFWSYPLDRGNPRLDRRGDPELPCHGHERTEHQPQAGDRQ